MKANERSLLRAEINAIHAELAGRASAMAVYQVAITRGIFTTFQLQRFARRAAVEFIRGALSEINPETGVPRSQPVDLGDQEPVWIQLPLMNAAEFSEVLRSRTKGLIADWSEFRRLYEYGVVRFGRDHLPVPPQLDMDLN
jgi:hypothetical protein